MQQETIHFMTIDEQLAENLRFPLSFGTYEFDIADAKLCRAKSSGKRMLSLRLHHQLDNGIDCYVYDNLMLDYKHMMYKLHHFLKSACLSEYIEQGAVPLKSLIGSTCKAKIFVKKDKTGQYADSLAVEDYVVDMPLHHESDTLDDDISF